MEPDITANKHHHNPHSFLANLSIAGRKFTLRETIYLALKNYGPQTCEQLSLRLGLRYTTVSARLSELKAMTWVACTGEDRETTGGTRAAVIRHVTFEERDALLNPHRGYRGRQASLFQ